jgi:hypothetical protein
MSQSSKPRIDPSIIAALIGLVGTVTVTLISIFANRSASPQPTAVPAPTEIFPTFTGAQTPETPDATSAATLPAVKYPDGKLFKLFYDDNSFYLLNLSDAAVPINRIAFERLSDDDVPLNRFNGTRWSEFHADSLPGKCDVLQILGGSPFLDPPECSNEDVLSLRTPTREDPSVFWTAQEGSHQFRVLWRGGGPDEEIGRCEIDAGVCEVFLP